MKCFNHVDLDAVATCQVCGKGLCHDCAAKYTPCMCDSCAAAQVQLAEESEINYEKAAKAEYKARRKYEKKEAGRYLSEQWRANTAIGFVAAAGFYVYNDLVVKPDITNAGWQSMFSDTNLICIGIILGVYIIGGVILMFVFRHKKFGSILGKEKNA